MDSNLLGFAALAALITLSPGADFALVVRRAVASPFGEAVATSTGICTGLLVWASLSAVGVAALLAASASAYEVLKLVGAAYLIVLGALSLREARRAVREAARSPAAPPPAEVPLTRRGRPTAFVQGLLNNLLNPKIAVFYTAVLPQFVSPEDPVLAVSLLFAALHAAMGMAWLVLCAWFAGRSAARLERPRVRAVLESVTGSVLIGIGLRVALEPR
jgi:threonine/homoserine/homoserine lactone efflux protein